ncbi:MAG: hypothetical protein JO264_04505 [Acidisphaera sp.]|nr:hypothetical protein [Acidisphaera sp.]
MTIPRLNAGQLWWMRLVIIPLAIACGVLLLVLEGYAVSPTMPWGTRCASTLFEIVLIGAIGRLAYRGQRLRMLGDATA